MVRERLPPVGPLDAPSKWADDICGLEGINYESLSEFQIPSSDGGTEQSPASDYDLSKQYVGDYVQALQEFVEYYNIDFPSHEGNDVTLLSLRDDLMVDSGVCSAPAKNLLLNSGRLDLRSSWESLPCGPGETECLEVLPGALALDGTVPLSPPPNVPGGSVAWLVNVDAPAKSGAITNQPGQTVYQPVLLSPGADYVLSWWATARALDGTVAAAPADYPAAVYDENWRAVASVVDTASDAEWGSRREMSFRVPEEGYYYVTFAAAVPGTADGSVAIANVQLEEASVATTYQPTGQSRLALTGNCLSQDPQAFRDAFEYKCEDNKCFYELKSPITIDTTTATEGTLYGKLATGNFNFRHITTALNVVGTGVLDCSKDPSPSCYGTGYLQYTLEHEAFGVPVINHTGAGISFDFGKAQIERGKALTAERYLTLPLGSADQGLIAQEQFTKPEFLGRPLSGTYRFRIWDTPALDWQRVEDVQLVVNYRYWSRLQRAQAEE